MPEALLIFTFSPIQSFIGEARRTADLYVGSRILVELANAVRDTLTNDASWIYPSQNAKNGSPNVLVARVQVASVESLTQVEGPAKQMEEALIAHWKTIALSTKKRLADPGLPVQDSKWEEIWNRQVDHQWETAWAAALLDGRPYAEAYQEARVALEAVRRARPFAPADEDGLKDSLSGARSALRTEENDAADYGEQLNRHFGAVRIRKNERLDALGAVKRFSQLAESTRFPSTSDVATADYLQRARQQALKALRDYQEAIQVMLDFPKSNEDWPSNYDGDLLYLDTLTPKRLEREYDVAFEGEENQARRNQLKRAKEKLRTLYQTKQTEEESLGSPSAYYAILVLDGDSMREMVSLCREAQDHKDFSQSLTAFASQVRPEAKKFLAEIVYNGGDDVLAFAPLARAVPFAQRLAQVFAETVKAKDRSGTLSGGIAIVHHNHPLGSALRAARLAERQAKKVRGKAAVCVRVLRRGGEPVEVCSSWKALGNLLNDSVKHFEQHLSSRFAYSVAEKAEVGRGLEAEARRALLHYFVQRHASESANGQLDDYAQRLTDWSITLDNLLPAEAGIPVGLREVSGWVRLARFLSQKGGEAA